MMTTAAITTAALTALLLAGCSAAAAGAGGAAPTTSSASIRDRALDGIYRWSTTIDQTKGTAEGAEFDHPTDTSLVVAPDTFTLTLQDGQWSMITTATPRHDGGTYTADGTALVMEWTILPPGEGPLHMEYDYTVGEDGTVTLVPTGVTDPVDVFVYSANPWTKIG